MRMARSLSVDLPAVRSAVGDLVEPGSYDSWLMTAPDAVLVRLAAPLEMLQFQYYQPRAQDRHLVRAAQVCCEAADGGLQGCTADMIGAFSRLAKALLPTVERCDDR